MTPLASVDIAAAVSWLSAIPWGAWPQQRLGELRPAMVTDLEWHSFGVVVGPVVDSLMQHFPVGAVPFQRMLSAVMPGHSIESHCDQQAPYWLCRVHVPLMSNDRAWFLSGGARHYLKPGFAYCIDTRAEHGVINDGDTPRVHFMFDVRRS